MNKDRYIKRIKNLHKKKTGKSISDAAALAYLEKLVVLVGAIYQPIPTKEYEKLFR